MDPRHSAEDDKGGGRGDRFVPPQRNDAIPIRSHPYDAGKGISNPPFLMPQRLRIPKISEKAKLAWSGWATAVYKRGRQSLQGRFLGASRPTRTFSTARMASQPAQQGLEIQGTAPPASSDTGGTKKDSPTRTNLADEQGATSKEAGKKKITDGTSENGTGESVPGEGPTLFRPGAGGGRHLSGGSAGNVWVRLCEWRCNVGARVLHSRTSGAEDVRRDMGQPIWEKGRQDGAAGSQLSVCSPVFCTTARRADRSCTSTACAVSDAAFTQCSRR